MAQLKGAHNLSDLFFVHVVATQSHEANQLQTLTTCIESNLDNSMGVVCPKRPKDKKREGLPSLALPKVRQDRLTEIITINAGCLNFCTYCPLDHNDLRDSRFLG